MKQEKCPACKGPAVRLLQDGTLSCVRQCTETPEQRAAREELQKLAVRMAEIVERHIPRGGPVGFTVVVFDYGRNGGIAYASTGERVTTRMALRELFDKWEAETAS